MIKLILLVAFVFFLTACSSSDQLNEEKDLESKVYSDETNRAFEMIERGYGNSAVQKNLSTVQAPQVGYQSTKPKASKTTSIPSIPVAPKAAPEKKQSDKKDEKMIELNQNLAFYCMKHRKDNRFKNDEKKCIDYVTGILNQCQSNNSAHSKLLSCVKKKLTLK